MATTRFNTLAQFEEKEARGANEDSSKLPFLFNNLHEIIMRLYIFAKERFDLLYPGVRNNFLQDFKNDENYLAAKVGQTDPAKLAIFEKNEQLIFIKREIWRAYEYIRKLNDKITAQKDYESPPKDSKVQLSKENVDYNEFVYNELILSIDHQFNFDKFSDFLIPADNCPDCPEVTQSTKREFVPYLETLQKLAFQLGCIRDLLLLFRKKIDDNFFNIFKEKWLESNPEEDSDLLTERARNLQKATLEKLKNSKKMDGMLNYEVEFPLAQAYPQAFMNYFFIDGPKIPLEDSFSEKEYYEELGKWAKVFIQAIPKINEELDKRLATIKLKALEDKLLSSTVLELNKNISEQLALLPPMPSSSKRDSIPLKKETKILPAKSFWQRNKSDIKFGALLQGGIGAALTIGIAVAVNFIPVIGQIVSTALFIKLALGLTIGGAVVGAGTSAGVCAFIGEDPQVLPKPKGPENSQNKEPARLSRSSSTNKFLGSKIGLQQSSSFTEKREVTHPANSPSAPHQESNLKIKDKNNDAGLNEVNPVDIPYRRLS